MNQDYETRAYIAWNLDDAREELAHIIEMVKPEAKVEAEEFKGRMVHLYSHLNTAWNERVASAAEIEAASGEQLREWSGYPVDLKRFP